MAKKLDSCREVGLRLQTYLDGELDEDRKEQIRAHLDACVCCGLDADAFQEIKTNLANVSRASDEDAIKRLMEFSARIAEEASGATQ